MSHQIRMKSDHEERECRGLAALCRGLGCPQIPPLKRDHFERECRGRPALCRGLGGPQILPLQPGLITQRKYKERYSL